VTSASTILDSHVHFWDPALLRYQWLDGEEELNRQRLPSDVPTGAPPTSFVFVQADAGHQQGLREARWVDSLADSAPEVVAIVAFAPLEDGSAVRQHLQDLRTVPRVVGVRRLLQSENVDFFSAERLGQGLDEVEAAGLTFDACVRHHQLPALIDLVRRHPGLPVVLDHLGKPPLRDGITSEAGRGWVRNIHRLAELRNVMVKLSGLPAEAPSRNSAHDAFAPYLVEALDAFGPERAMFGRDWPVSAGRAGHVAYADWRDGVLALVQGDRRTDIAWRTAWAFYRIPFAPALRGPGKDGSSTGSQGEVEW
jgi:L-fuconolactonase